MAAPGMDWSRVTISPAARIATPARSKHGPASPPGAGKSPLIRCVNRLVEPTAGRIFLQDLELTHLKARALRQARRRIGMIFQEFGLVERLTVMENVLSGRLGYVGFWRSY
jgi:phosphonate transport system ATP-binding protein